MNYFYSVANGLGNVVNSILRSPPQPIPEHNNEVLSTQQIATHSLVAPRVSDIEVPSERPVQILGAPQAKLARRGGLTEEVQSVLDADPRFAEQICLGIVELYYGGPAALEYLGALLEKQENSWAFGRAVRVVFEQERLIEDEKFYCVLLKASQFPDRVAMGLAVLAMFDDAGEDYLPLSREPLLPKYSESLILHPDKAYDLSLSFLDLREELLTRYHSDLEASDDPKTLASAVSWLERENRSLFQRCSHLLFAHPEEAMVIAVARVMLERADMATIRNCNAIGVGPEARRIADGIVEFKDQQDLLTEERLNALVENPDVAWILARKMLRDPTRETRTVVEEVLSARVKSLQASQDLISPIGNLELDARSVASAARYLEGENFCTESNLKLLRSRPVNALSIAMICVLIRDTGFYFDENTHPEFYRILAAQIAINPLALLTRLTEKPMLAGTPDKFLKIIENSPFG